jgi:hypothetical protein
MRLSTLAVSAAALAALAACNGAQNGHGAPPATERAAPVTAQTAPAPREIEAVASNWRPFSDDSPWNTKIPADARIDANSADFIRELASFNALHINVELWSVPVYEIDMARTPMREVRSLYSGSMGRGFESGLRIPVPEGVMPARPHDGGTGYIALLDRARGLVWEMNQMGWLPNGNLFAGFGALTDLRGTGVAEPWAQAETPAWSAGARPSGVPLIAGLLRPEAVRQGRIDHALAFAYPGARTTAFISPASIARTPGDGNANPFGLPFGARIQLDPEFDVEAANLSPAGKAIARALQEYGAILVDEAGGLTLFADSSPEALEAWQGLMTSEELHRVFHPGMMAANFRVLEIGEPLPGPPVQPR